jgi:HK97 family phage portal protein
LKILEGFKNLFKNVLTREKFYGSSFSSGNYSGEVVTEITALRQSAVYACVRLLANSLSSLPIKIFKRSTLGDRDLLPDHSLSKLLAFKPNSYQTSYEWREQSMLHLLLRGEALSRVYRDNYNRVTEIIPIPPSMFSYYLDPSGTDLIYNISYSNGEMEELTKKDVLHIRGLFSDILHPITPIQFHAQTIGLDQAMLKHQEASFGPNASHPGGILSSDAKIKPETADRIMNLFNSRHGGSINARKTLLLEQGMKFQPLQMTNADAEFIESRKMSVSDICRIFSVPEPERLFPIPSKVLFSF